MANKFPLILNTSANQIQEIASGDNLDLTGCGINNAGVITATSFSGNITGGVTGNADTATLATNVNVTANNSTNETVYPIFVDGATGTQGAESDTGLTYNPSSGNLTSTQLTGTLQTAAQTNITSVGTLSALNVSGNVSIGGTLTYEDVTNIDSVGLITARNGVSVTSGGIKVLAGVSNFNANIVGTATTALSITTADESSDTSCNVLFATAATGNLAPKTGTNLTFNSSSGALTATSFAGDGSALTGISAGPGTGESYVKARSTSAASNSGSNVFAGPNAGAAFNGSSGDHNTFFGINAGQNNDAGQNNTFLGSSAGNTNVSGHENVAIGQAAYENGTGGKNIAIGRRALQATSSTSSNVGIGYEALKNQTSGQLNTAVGYQAGLRITAALYNTAVGHMTLSGDGNSHDVTYTAQYNTVMGYNAGYGISSGERNVLIGASAGYDMTTGKWNSGLGHQVLENVGAGSSNTACGYKAGSNINSGSNNICIGHGVNATSASTSNEITLGNSDITKFRIPGPAFEVVKNSTSDHMIMLGTTDSSAGAWSGTRQGLKLVGSQPLVYYVDNGNTSGDDAYVGHAGSSLYIAKKGGSVTFQTSASGAATASRWYINSTGHFIPSSDANYDIGTSSARVRNVYTNDLNLSNEGHKNDVDGTWGNYTIQEGEDDLFLINRRSGKKYKFNLTEVP